MTSNENCLFCKIVANVIPARRVFEDEHVIAFEDINPQAPTHLLVIPRRHIASTDELGPGDHETMGRVVARAAALAREHHLESEGYRMVINCGPNAGQTVFHIHLHLIGGRVFSWPPG